MSVLRIYVEKREAYAAHAGSVLNDLISVLGIHELKKVRILNRYDVEGISKEIFDLATPIVFSEPPVDVTYTELPKLAADERLFATEFLPGQFDQRADSCEQCIQFLTCGDRPKVKSAQVYILKGNITDTQFEQIKHYLINPVESREASLALAETLNQQYDTPTTVQVLSGFTSLDEEGLAAFIRDYGLAMDQDDIRFCQDYFKNTEHRDPTLTEIRMIDTYWSDHCRHTTFLTQIDQVDIEDDAIRQTYQEYLLTREDLYQGKDKPITLMDLAVIAAKKLKKDGLLPDLDESEEINACSVKIKIDVDGKQEDWLLMFKNETHNHPTEIEPFGGAATCLGGAIRDPLSGRAYVFGAMRVTGAADPLVGFDQTIPGKLPQRKIVTTAANGYSSYGNQIGLATGHVAEVYHPGYVAKRMEIGAVLGAVPAENVIRERPQPGDVVILLGGKTGRDGCGGATGSSKSHTLSSLETCGAEVQKGNPPEERKIQRLFRNPEVTRLIKRCNDFGAGGVSVAIGELADGLEIDLDKVPKKYDGLDGTELAISESQERMAVVVAAEDAEKFIAQAHQENLLATQVATVTASPRLKMHWLGNTIVDLSREFLNSNGAEKHTSVKIPKASVHPVHTYENTKEQWVKHLSSLNICSQKGLVERFDASIGAGSVLMPYGGAYQLTPTQALAMKIPVRYGNTSSCALMAWGFNPYLSEQSPYHAAQYAVIESVAKVVAAGGSHQHCWLTFQEYFERTQNDPVRWGQPMSALLGAFKAQMELGIASIGGKDSMSGTFENIDVPPTLVSFAVSTANAQKVVSPEFKGTSTEVAMILPQYNKDGTPDYKSIKETFTKVEKLIADGTAKAVWALSYGGVSEAIFKMCLGNRTGFVACKELSSELLFNPCYGGFIIELSGGASTKGLSIIGVTGGTDIIAPNGIHLEIDKLQAAYEQKLEPVFPSFPKVTEDKIPTISFHTETPLICRNKTAKPRVLIPVFPGTNCEYDTARAFEKEGAETDIFVIRNLTGSDIEESVEELVKRLQQAQILMFPGGFSAGDEPDGSGKFITAFFRNPKLKEEVHNLLQKRDGLALGICNGFQALIKLGLVPFGKIVDMHPNSPTLTFNSINRHQSMMTRIRVCSDQSPWMKNLHVGAIHCVPISHGEGRFVAPPEVIEQLIVNGQVATQYVDMNDDPTYDIRFNPNNSVYAIEGITSADGRVLGKMAHSERVVDPDVCKNIPSHKDQLIFRSGVEYFK